MIRPFRCRRIVHPLTVFSAMLAIPLLVRSRSAAAALGEDEASITADEAQMKGDHSAIAGEKYTVHEIRTRSGISIREYIVPGNKVFAVTWRGPWLPDMRQLLGTYFGTFSRALRVKHSRHRPFVIVDPALVVHSSGHMRSFFGEAHVPSLVPEGVSVEALL